MRLALLALLLLASSCAGTCSAIGGGAIGHGAIGGGALGCGAIGGCVQGEPGDAGPDQPWDGGELVAASVYDALEVIATASDTTVRTESDSLIAGGDDHGPYTWARLTGPLVLDSEEAWDDVLGAGHDDLRPALVYVDGDVMVSHDPARRRPFVAMHVTGTLDLDEDINGYGANHSASGSDKPSTRILWRVGTYGGVTDPQVPAAGGDGGSTNSAGSAGTGGGLGGGGGGASSGVAGVGAAGSSYSGGAGGGARQGSSLAGDGEERGGAGGAGTVSSTPRAAGGGAGNPGGAYAATGPYDDPAYAGDGESRTGGVWYIVAGEIAGPGSIDCDGGDGGQGLGTGGVGGGASGGGHVTVQAAVTSSWSGAATANGGAGGEGGGGGASGGNGGLGTARVLPLTEDSP